MGWGECGEKWWRRLASFASGLVGSERNAGDTSSVIVTGVGPLADARRPE